MHFWNIKSLRKRLEELEDIVYKFPVIKYVNKSPNPDPVYAKPGDSGFDLRAWVDENTDGAVFDEEKKEFYVKINPHEIKLIRTGNYFDLPEFTEIQVRPRSGLSLKVGLTVNNSPGTVDEMFTGEVCVILINPTDTISTVYNNDRIAQAVLCPVFNQRLVTLYKVEEIEKETERGSGGFGHTGIK